jgi:hypothetical protein
MAKMALPALFLNGSSDSWWSRLSPTKQALNPAQGNQTTVPCASYGHELLHLLPASSPQLILQIKHTRHKQSASFFSQNSIRFQHFAHRIRPVSSQIKQQKQGSDCRTRRFKPTRKKSQKWGWIEKRYRRNRDGWRRLTILDRVAGRRKRRPAEEGKGGSARRGEAWVPRRSSSLCALSPASARSPSLLLLSVSLSSGGSLRADSQPGWRVDANDRHRRNFFSI